MHQQKFALTCLNPSNIIVEKSTGRFKLREMNNPLPIDEFYPSSIEYPINRYSAPEILMMDEVLAESDFYSLGLILYEIMKNKVGFCDISACNSLKNERQTLNH